MSQLRPPYENVRAHYDLSNEFFELFLGPTVMYTSAYYERDDMTLDEAQLAKIDLALRKLDLQPGQRLLDVGCGWGSLIFRTVEQYAVTGVGITLSEVQLEYCQEKARLRGLQDSSEFRVQGWEEFEEPVDRISVIEVMEHFKEERYGAFFEKCCRLLPSGAPMIVQSIVFPEWDVQRAKCQTMTAEGVQFAKFIGKKIFPGGQLRMASVICRYAWEAGFQLDLIESLQPHYVRTLSAWADNLEANRLRAIEVTSQDTYDMYMHYLRGCAKYYDRGELDVVQISLSKAA